MSIETVQAGSFLPYPVGAIPYQLAPKLANVRPGVPGVGSVITQLPDIYARDGWELGRLTVPPQYDPGPYPGFGRAVFGNRWPW